MVCHQSHPKMNASTGRKTLICYLGIAVAAALLFIPFLGQVHLFDWDEINFAESAREMIASHDYLNVKINFVSFYEKPPLFIWMQVASMKLFGVNEFAARFPDAVCGIISLLVIFHIGRKVSDIPTGLTWVLLFAGSLLPFMYFKSGIIDPWFNLFIFLGIYNLHLYIKNESQRTLKIAASAFFIGLAVLTKGPAGLLIYLLTAGIYLLLIRFRIKTNPKDLFLFSVVLIITGGLWFILQIVEGNFGIIADFIAYQVRLFSTHGAGHRGFIGYHFVVLFFGVFPASLFALPVLLGTKKLHDKPPDFYRWMLILFWVVLILFTIVKTKIVHYSSMCYFPMTFMAAWWLRQKMVPARTMKIIKMLVAVIGIVLAVLVAALTMVEYYKDLILPHIKDPFAAACLAADAHWHGHESIVSLVLITGIVLFLVFWEKQKQVAVYLLTGMMMAFMFLCMYLITPRVEMYSQRAAIEFFSSVKDEDAYLTTIGYKSYAHYFYGRIRDYQKEESRDPEWLLTGQTDRPVYIAAKAYKKDKYLAKYTDLKVLYEKNGFVFFKRIPK
jgi:4-amino-4-deoxy-L-arabinose transferase-like glycosyltransferase